MTVYDMYGAVSESAQVKLPSGTFSYSYSMYYETDEEATRIEDCVVDLAVLTSDGKSRHVTFRGQPEVNDYSE